MRIHLVPEKQDDANLVPLPHRSSRSLRRPQTFGIEILADGRDDLAGSPEPRAAPPPTGAPDGQGPIHSA